MIRTIDKPCPGDCSLCQYPNEVPGFDMYGCALNQMLQRVTRVEQEMKELRGSVESNACIVEEEKVIIKNTEGRENETSNEALPEQDGEERVLDE